MEKINIFAQKLSGQTKERIEKLYPMLSAYHEARVKIVPGKKYIKVDIGGSGKYMVDKQGNIYGIKGYGVINKKKQFGDLDTIEEYFWGGYSPVKVSDKEGK